MPHSGIVNHSRYARLIEEGYVDLPRSDASSPEIVHYTLTDGGRAALEQHEKIPNRDSHSPEKRATRWPSGRRSASSNGYPLAFGEPA